ncbi:MAG: hypothetical protein QW076_04190 [Candidatus Anstonellales archaeon]
MSYNNHSIFVYELTSQLISNTKNISNKEAIINLIHKLLFEYNIDINEHVRERLFINIIENLCFERSMKLKSEEAIENATDIAGKLIHVRNSGIMAGKLLLSIDDQSALNGINILFKAEKYQDNEIICSIIEKLKSQLAYLIGNRNTPDRIVISDMALHFLLSYLDEISTLDSLITVLLSKKLRYEVYLSWINALDLTIKHYKSDYLTEQKNSYFRKTLKELQEDFEALLEVLNSHSTRHLKNNFSLQMTIISSTSLLNNLENEDNLEKAYKISLLKSQITQGITSINEILELSEKHKLLSKKLSQHKNSDMQVKKRTSY